MVVGVIVLFTGVGINPAVAKNQNNTISTPIGNTLYVGGSGLGNYTKIQDAIEDASDDDTVYVFNGTYLENLIVNISISLIGEDKYLTIIDGTMSGNVIDIYADFVNIYGFTIINSGEDYCGINLNSNHNNIINNIIMQNNWGIYLEWFKSNNNIIHRNNVSNNNAGISIITSNNNSITENVIDSNYHYGISLYSSGCKNIISRNKITSNTIFGFIMGFDPHYNDSFEYNSITNNIFIENGKNAQIVIYGFISLISNKWCGNYWDKPRVAPKLITGLFFIKDFKFPIFNVDWNPAKEPYDIDV